MEQQSDAAWFEDTAAGTAPGEKACKKAALGERRCSLADSAVHTPGGFDAGPARTV